MKIAMWSGPRNLSTAMMYSFGARADFDVMDEPFYAAYLQASGVQHPMRDEVLASQPTDPNIVARTCGATSPKRLFYMKHMPHHMLDGFALDWAKDCTNIHLIRHPARVIASYAQVQQNPTLEDIGFHQQLDLFTRVGGLVIDSEHIRANPEHALKTLCKAIDLPFDPAMLHWPKGGHPDDGIWAKKWYRGVHNSTGFNGPEAPLPNLPATLTPLLDAALPAYTHLKARALDLTL